MYLNQEKARRYREEQAEKIKFYRLDYEDSYDWPCNNGLGLSDYIKRVGESNTKYVYEFTEIPKVEKSVMYGDFVDDFLPNYHFHPYVDSEIYKEDTAKYLLFASKQDIAQQEDFIKHFIEEGLSNYDFKHLEKTGYSKCAYIFLNPFDYRSKHKIHLCIDNVVWLPNEMITMYLIEKGLVAEGYYYINRITDLEKEAELFANFDFERSSSFSQKQIDDLLGSGLIEKEGFTRKIALDQYIANKYIVAK